MKINRLLGIDPSNKLYIDDERLVPITDMGEPVRELFSEYFPLLSVQFMLEHEAASFRSLGNVR